MELSTGRGASIGGPATPLPHETETTAANKTAQFRLGIVPEDKFEDVSFTKLGEAMTWKYQSDASKPTIPPLRHLPLAAKNWNEQGKEWPEEFANLLAFIPEDILMRYIAESKLPAEERSPEYGNLDTFIGMIANFMVWLKSISPAKESSESEEIRQNNLLLDQMNDQMKKASKWIIYASADMINAIGRNDRNFEMLNLLNNQLNAAVRDIENQDQAALSPLAGDLREWSAQLKNSDFGDNLQILKTLTNTMAIITAASAFGSGSSTLLLGLGFASIGIDNSESRLGLLPKSFALFRDNVTDSVLNPLTPSADNGSRLLTPLLVSALLVSTLTATSFAQSELNNPMLLNMALSFGVNSNLLTTIFSGVANTMGANEQTAPVVRDLLTLATVLFSIKTVATTDESQAISLIETLKSPMLQWLENLKSIASRTDQDLHNPTMKALNLFVQQGHLSLENSDYETFFESLGQLDLLADNAEDAAWDFKQQIEDYKEFLALVQYFITHTTKDEDLTHTNINVFPG